MDVKGPSSETAYDEQQNMIETDLHSGTYDAIVIAPLQADLVKTLISGQDIPIINLDTRIDALRLSPLLASTRRPQRSSAQKLP